MSERELLLESLGRTPRDRQMAIDCNQQRPHPSVDYRTWPEEFAVTGRSHIAFGALEYHSARTHASGRS
jgi:hypothetical protein